MKPALHLLKKCYRLLALKNDLISGLIDVNKSASKALQKIVKSIAGTKVNFDIKYHKSSGELELFFYHAADENYQHKSSFVIPLYDGSGSGRYHRQSISNSLVAYQDKEGKVRFIDSFGKAINDLADYLVGDDGKFKFTNDAALVRGSGANARFLKGGKDILDEDLKYSSSASTVGISNDIANSLRAGLTPEDMVMKSTQLSLITLNEQLAKRVMGEQFKKRSRDVKSVSQIITTYAVLRNKSPKLATTFLQCSDLNKYVAADDMIFAINQIESAYSTVLKTIPINVSSSVEDAVIEGLVRTSGGHSMVSFGSTIIGSGRGTTQRLTNYLRKNVKNVKDYEEQYKKFSSS